MINSDAFSRGPTPAKKWSISNPRAFDRYLSAIRLVTLLVLSLIGWLDYITGYEFGFFIFYFIPVAIAAWYGGRMPGLVNAVMCAFCWYLSDHYTSHPYSKAYFIYWETFMRLASFITTALSVARIRTLVLSEERMLAELLEARALLGGLQAAERSQDARKASTSDEQGESGSSRSQSVPESPPT
jgi:K+-sensing histidine kinase KdpD